MQSVKDTESLWYTHTLRRSHKKGILEHVCKAGSNVALYGIGHFQVLSK